MTERIRRGVSLTDDQWRIVKAAAAQRGQTISEYLSDLVNERHPVTISSTRKS